MTRVLPNLIEKKTEPVEKPQSIQAIVEPRPLSKKEKDKWALVQEIKQTYHSGSSQREIARSFQMSRNTVKKYIELEKPMVYFREASVSKIIQPFYELVSVRVISGSTITSIYQELKTLGFKGSYSIVQRTVNQLKPKQPAFEPLSQQIPRKKVIYYFWKPHESLSNDQKRVMDIVLNDYPKTQPIYGFVQLFREVFSTFDLEKYLQLIPLFEQEEMKEIKRYLRMLREDKEAIKASFLYTFNTSIVEGQINRLKMIKRLMYGRASIKLLEKRVLFAG